MRIETLEGGTLGDTYLHVYQRPFNPLNSCLNIVASDDDGAGFSFLSLIEGIFPAGNYDIVVTSFRQNATGTYFLQIE